MTVVRYGIPGDLLAELERRSELTGEPVDRVAERLIARVLPVALAEAAQVAFGHLAAAAPLFPDKDQPGLSPGLVNDFALDTSSSLPMVAAARPGQGPPADGAS